MTRKRLILVFSGSLAIQGIVLICLAEDTQELLGLEGSPLLHLGMQILGSVQLGWGILNAMSR